MKIASGILSLIFGLLIFLQSCVVGVGGSIFGEESAAQGGSVGFFVAILFIIGGSFSFALPKVSMVIMTLAGILGIAVGATTAYGDMTVWGVIALVLAALNFFGSRKKKTKEDTTTAPPTP